MTATPLQLYDTDVSPDWVDYNGHMNDASYGIVFSRATDALIEYIGLDATYREREQRSVFTLENHICFLQEAHQSETLSVTTQLLGHDAKRLRVFHTLYRNDGDSPLATSEQMLLHVDSGARKAALFDTAIAARVQGVAHAHKALAVPEQAGRAILALV